MATDEEVTIFNVLSTNWNTGNAQLPLFYYDDSIKLHDFVQFDAIKIYLLNRIEKAKNLGYTSYRTDIFATIDIRSRDRTRMLNDLDEVKRIIRANRKTLPGYEIFTMTNERKQANYINYFQYIIEVKLVKYITVIP